MTQERRDRIQDQQQYFVDKYIRLHTENQLVLDAFLQVDRGSFLPNHLQHLRDIAKTDEIIPLDDHSSMSQPSLIAGMIDSLEITGSERVLEVGTATGYTAALLSVCASEVHTIEQDEKLGTVARERLSLFGFNNVTTHIGDGAAGLSQHAPFDRIIVTACVRDIPQALFDQLNEGGIIVAPVEYEENYEVLVKGVKRGNTLHIEELERVRFFQLQSDQHGGFSPEAVATQPSFDIVIMKSLPESEPDKRIYGSNGDFARKNKITREAVKNFKVFEVDPSVIFKKE